MNNVVDDLNVGRIMKFWKDVDYFRTTFPENINSYLKHRGLDGDNVVGITKDGGYYYVFYKELNLEEAEEESQTQNCCNHECLGAGYCGEKE